jgi:hypothetical protein
MAKYIFKSKSMIEASVATFAPLLKKNEPFDLTKEQAAAYADFIEPARTEAQPVKPAAAEPITKKGDDK